MRPLGRSSYVLRQRSQGLQLVTRTRTNLSLKKNPSLKPKPIPKSSESQWHADVHNTRQTLSFRSVPSSVCPHPEAMPLKIASCGNKSQEAEKTMGLGEAVGFQACFSFSAVGFGASQFHQP